MIMCRYATAYKPHYACFKCRKTFKRRLITDIKRGTCSLFKASCPQCGELTADMGLDFESPKKNNIKAWQHLEKLYVVGITFHSCGCSGPGYIPHSLPALIAYLENIKREYLKNIDFWRKRIEPKTKPEIESDRQRSWSHLIKLPKQSKKTTISNQEAINYWLGSVSEIEQKIALLQ